MFLRPASFLIVRSKLMVFFLIVLVMMASFCVINCQQSVVFDLAFLSLFLCYLLVELRSLGYCGGRYVQELHFEKGHYWLLIFSDGEIYRSILQKQSVVTRLFIILFFKSSGRFFNTAVVITVDSMHKDALLQLRRLARLSFVVRDFK